MYPVRTREVPETQILSVKRHVRQPQLVSFLREWMAAVPAVLDARGIDHSRYTFVIYHGAVSADSDGPVEVCTAFDGAIEAPEGMQVRTEPAHLEAFARISKEQSEFPLILQAYDAVRTFAAQQDLEPAAPPREIYFVDVDSIGPTDSFVDVARPITPARQLATSTAS